MANPTVSVFTPTHNPRYLRDAWSSLREQTFPDWEWVILLNEGDGGGLRDIAADPRVNLVCTTLTTPGSVGEAKRRAVELCRGSILVELDHDDLLLPTCLEQVVEAVTEQPQASLVYSSFAQVNEDGSANDDQFAAEYGWVYGEVDGMTVPRNLLPTPHNVSLIWYAPNHVRAFTRTAYEQTTGYDSGMSVLDDLSLMAQLYQVGPFVPIDTPLYLQRLHPSNTQRDLAVNHDIQIGTWELYERNIQAAAGAWAERNGLSVSDSIQAKGRERYYGYIRSYNEVCADDDLQAVLRAAWRRLAPNGLLLLMAREDRHLNEHFFRAWCATERALFQESRIRTIDHDGERWVQANLIAVKQGYTRDGGILYARTDQSVPALG